jgi:hypothetical protein
MYDEEDVTITFKGADGLREKLIQHGVSPALFEPSWRAFRLI